VAHLEVILCYPQAGSVVPPDLDPAHLYPLTAGLPKCLLIALAAVGTPQLPPNDSETVSVSLPKLKAHVLLR
jgi:hypothetical protein